MIHREQVCHKKQLPTTSSLSTMHKPTYAKFCDVPPKTRNKNLRKYSKKPTKENHLFKLHKNTSHTPTIFSITHNSKKQHNTNTHYNTSNKNMTNTHPSSPSILTDDDTPPPRPPLAPLTNTAPHANDNHDLPSKLTTNIKTMKLRLPHPNSLHSLSSPINKWSTTTQPIKGWAFGFIGHHIFYKHFYFHQNRVLHTKAFAPSTTPPPPLAMEAIQKAALNLTK
jgi:hypothetical protein